MSDRPNHPFDIASKMIVDADPLAFARLCGPADSAELMDTNFASNVYADRLVKVKYGDSVFLRQFEAQSSYNRKKLADAAHYATGAYRVHELPIYSTFVLLHKGADGPAMTGIFDEGAITFNFEVLRLWEYPVEEFLNGELSLMPLAAVCEIPERSLPDIVKYISQRISSEPTNLNPDSLWVEFRLLLGLNYPENFVMSLLKGVGNMQESSTYRAILAEGEARGIAVGEARGIAVGEARGKREAVLRVGSKRFGEPDAHTRSILDQIDSPERLDGLLIRVIDAESWSELLGHLSA